MKVIILNGSGGVGKDTFAGYVSEYVGGKSKQYYFYRASMITPIKDMAKCCGLWYKDEKTRKFLSDLKTLTEEYSDYPFRKLIDTFEFAYYNLLNKSSQPREVVFVVDIREPKDIHRFMGEIMENYLVNANDICTVCIKSNRVKEINSNIADASVNDFIYDHIITNNGTKEELCSDARKFAIDFIF